MHVDFVPITTDGRLTAKEVCGGRVDLQKMQDNFYKHISTLYPGLERGKRTDLQEAPTRKHERINEYKNTTNYYQQQQDALQDNVQALQSTKDKLVEILHTEPQNVIQSVSVPLIKDKVLIKTNELEKLNERARAIEVMENPCFSVGNDIILPCNFLYFHLSEKFCKSI